MTKPQKELLEREWIGEAIRHARITRGLKQRELVELAQAAGLQWSQGILAKIELGTREVTISELLLMCVCLGTTPVELLYPQESGAGYLRLPSGRAWNIDTLGVLLEGTPLTARMAEVHSFPGQPKNVVTPEDVLEVAIDYLADPDAVTIAGITGLEAKKVTKRIAAVAAGALARYGVRHGRRKTWTARGVLDLMQESVIEAELAAGNELSEHAKRAIRNSLTHVLAKLITSPEWTGK